MYIRSLHKIFTLSVFDTVQGCRYNIYKASFSPGPGFRIYIPFHGKGWPNYTPTHWVPFMSSLTARRATVEVIEPRPHDAEL
jgi:hypothetical protein